MSDQYLRVFLAFLFVIGLIGLLSVVLRKISPKSFLVSKDNQAKKTLSIIEILPLDSKRRLILVKTENKKHLLLLGANSETVVESVDE